MATSGLVGNFSTAYEAGEPILVACRACSGAGLVNKLPGIEGDHNNSTAVDSGPYPCSACCGVGFVHRCSQRGTTMLEVEYSHGN